MITLLDNILKQKYLKNSKMKEQSLTSQNVYIKYNITHKLKVYSMDQNIF